MAVPEQQPVVQGINPGTYQNLINNYHRKCLAVNSAGNRNGKPLIHYDRYSSFTDQYWRFEPIAEAPGCYRLRNQNTGRCVAVANPNNDEADTLKHLGHTQRVLGQHDLARATWQRSLELYRAQHRADDAARIQEHLDGYSTSSASESCNRPETPSLR